jgi:hypothetical protein
VTLTGELTRLTACVAGVVVENPYSAVMKELPSVVDLYDGFLLNPVAVSVQVSPSEDVAIAAFFAAINVPSMLAIVV